MRRASLRRPLGVERAAGTSAGPQSGSEPPAMTSGGSGVAPSVVQPAARVGTAATWMPSPADHARPAPSGENVGCEKRPPGASL